MKPPAAIPSAVVLCCLAAWSAVTPETVVATINDRKVTAGELDRVLRGAPGQLQESLRKNPRLFVQNYALVTHLNGLAEKEGLAEKSPYRQQLEWTRLQTLWQAAVDHRYRQLRESEKTEEAADAAMRAWMDQVRESLAVTPVDADYFSSIEAARAAKPETVIARVNEKDVTAGEIRDLMTGASSEERKKIGAEPEQMVKYFAFVSRMAAIARENKLEQQSPYQEQLAWVRSNILSQAALNEYTNRISIGTKEEREYYDAHGADFASARVKVLYVAFGSGAAAAGKNVLTEEQAAARIESLRAQVDRGADFVALVREHSEDATSKAKDGDFGTFRRSDKIPETIKAAIFSLRPGEVSRPVRQPNGFYLFRLEELKTPTLDEVRQELIPAAKTAGFTEWFEGVRASIRIGFENEEYFADGPGR